MDQRQGLLSPHGIQLVAISKAKRRFRLVKTVVLAFSSVGVLAWAAVRFWDVDPQELEQFFLLCLLLLGITIVLGIAGAAVMILLKKRR